MQEPTLLRLNRKGAKLSDCTLVPWPIAASDQCSPAELKCNDSGGQEPSKDVTAVTAEPTSNDQSMASGDPVAQQGADGNPKRLFVVVFDQASRLVWGSNQQSLHDVLGQALVSQHALFVLPVQGHEAEYSSDQMSKHLTTAKAALLQQA